MKFRWFILAIALLVLASRPAAASALGRSPTNFSLAPAPADFTSDVGERPEGEGGAASWDPVALLVSSPFKYTVSLRQGYDTNVFSSHIYPIGSATTNLAIGTEYQFGNQRLQVDASLGLGVTYYYSRPDDNNDINGQFGLTAVYLLNRRITLSFSTSTSYLSQPDTNIIGASSQNNGDYIVSNTSLEAKFQLSAKFSTVTGYQFYSLYYMQEPQTQTLSYVSQTFKESLHWLFLPKTTLVAEYRANPITYAGQDQLNSFGNFLLVGFDQIFSPRFKWTMRFGAEQRFLQNPVDGNTTSLGPFLQSEVSYQFGPTSAVGWNIRYGTEPSGVANVSQRQTFRTGLSLVHGFTSRISGNLGLNYEVDNYEQRGVISSYTQTVIDISGGLNFKINKALSLSANCQYISITSPENPFVEYTRTVAFVGVNFDF